MDGPASKRRRVSPRTSSVNIGSSSSDDAILSSQHSPIPAASRPPKSTQTKAGKARQQSQTLDEEQPAPPATDESGRKPVEEATNAPTAAANASAQEEDEAAQSPRSLPSGQAEGSSVGLPIRSPFKPRPRPLPPPAPEGDDEADSFLGRRQRRSPNSGRPISFPEPELPPPSAPDSASFKPPKGIHSSPSRWRDKPRPKKSSPLKPSASQPLGKPRSKPGLPMHSFELPPRDIDSTSGERLLHDKAHPARQVSAFDPNGAKKKELEALDEEIAQLKRDLQIVSKENDRIRLMQSSGRILSFADEEEVFDVVRRHLIDSEAKPLPPPSQQLLKAALNPSALLPFGRTTPVVATTEDEVNIADVRSHHPVKMTAEEELPYLQLFSPFEVSSTMAVLHAEGDQPLRQRRVMTFRSKDAPGLFTSKVEMVVNATNSSIMELKIQSLEPAARAELGPFVTRICEGDCNRSMQRNVGILSWAMGEWYQAAVHRAQLWSKLDRELASKSDFLQAVAEARRKKPLRRTAEEMEEETGKQPAPALSFKKAELVHFMGQQAFEFNIPSKTRSEATSSVRLEWKIDFDWIGEAQNKVTVMVGVPGKWRKADQRGVLGKLPKLFEDLVEGGQDPSLAVKTIVALVVGEQ
ncbi:hypothetical protein BBK36DRAFT_1172575 [Trichoderma citrinoviride]|uniref:Uncharacterized protein n=1 Tax=Trichoderma citrinoviride TaxID=58853 RepID=A0A2T4AZG5_9HYPO|nr:hypothetical protein BBK36DRAFT_1172575 [Trichoderma citrinoviride]PTB62378.1 hypothetical protein BBK36DRAFT_1172575 [Trichoderma citrinoviride]